MANLAKAKPKTVQPVARRVYSYIRFSTPEQALGDSERRQADKAKEWATRKGFEFDETLKDEGLSGRGTHRTKGKLGLFLQRVKDGSIPNGSVLVVENIDRLSREGARETLRKIIFELWDSNITIQTLGDDAEEYPPGCENDPKFVTLLMYVQRAWKESARKSGLIREARDSARTKAREEKTILTSRAPAWLKVVNGEFCPIPAAARTIKQIYDMRAKGISVRKIESHLIESAEWIPPKSRKKQETVGWRSSYVQKILSNRAVIGEYQPYKLNGDERKEEGEPIKGYYPAVVKPGRFFAVQEKAKARQHTGGQTGKFHNVLRNLVKCAYCDGPLHFVDKGKPPKGAAYLWCEHARLKKCDAPMIRYDECEELVLENCPRLRPEQVLPNPSEKTKQCKLLQRRIEGADGELQSIERKLDNYVDLIGDAATPEIGKRLQDKMVDLGKQKQSLIEQRQLDASALSKLDQGFQSFKAWTASLNSLRKALAKGDNPELRLRLNNELRAFISKIDVFTVGHERWGFTPKRDKAKVPSGSKTRILDAATIPVRRLDRPATKGNAVRFADGESLADKFQEMMAENNLPRTRTKEFRAFLEFVNAQRTSKKGRFLRVHFTSGAIVDLVPDGSIATGLQLIDGKGWSRVEPEFNRLWRKFQLLA